MSKTIVASALAALLLSSVTLPADASGKLAANGKSLNGVSLNRIASNGISLNGMKTAAGAVDEIVSIELADGALFTK